MKKIFTYTILCSLALLFLPACEKKEDTKKGGDPIESTMRGVFRVVTDGSETMQLLEGKSKTVEARITTPEDAISDQTVTISLKVDPKGVDVYNALNADSPAKMLPSAAYSFTSNSMMLVRYNTSSTSAKIRLTAAGLEDNTLYVLPLSIDKVEGTDNWQAADDPYAYITLIQTNVGPEGGDGSMEYPFELKTVADLKAMKDKLSAEEKVYFKLMNDIDMAEVDDWTPLNYASPYELAVDFNGQGYTIDNFHVTDFGSYPSFFGVLNGYCHDVNFTNAVIECGADSGCGILGGYGGTGAIHADVARVHLQGKVTMKGNKTGIGGMFGCAGNATIEACSSEVDVYSVKNYVGGLVGYSKKVQIRNCWTGGSVRGDQRTGGIIGGINGDGDEVINSYSVAKLYIITEEGAEEYSATRSVGGIVGHANQDKGDQCDTRMPGNVVSGCIAWQDRIKTRTDLASDVDIASNNYYSSGAIVAFGATHNTYENCYRRADLDFRDYHPAFKLYDQENSSPSSPLMHQEVEGSSYNYPYHGKAAAAGATLTQVAKSLGWSTAVWDFSGDVPVIKSNAEGGPVPDVSAGGQLPGFGENEL